MNKQSIFNLFFSLTIIGIFTGWFIGKNPDSLQRDLLKVDYFYVILSMVFGAWAYVNRGFRWILLIDALGYKTSKTNSISAVSVGYFTNLFIPRAGEIARCTALKKSDNIPVDKLFGTILIERVIDFVFLLIGFFLALLLKSREISRSINEYQQIDSSESSYTKFIVLLVMIVSASILYFLRNKIKKLSYYQKVVEFIDGLKELQEYKEDEKQIIFLVSYI